MTRPAADAIGVRGATGDASGAEAHAPDDGATIGGGSRSVATGAADEGSTSEGNHTEGRADDSVICIDEVAGMQIGPAVDIEYSVVELDGQDEVYLEVDLASWYVDSTCGADETGGRAFAQHGQQRPYESRGDRRRGRGGPRLRPRRYRGRRLRAQDTRFAYKAPHKFT